MPNERETNAKNNISRPSQNGQRPAVRQGQAPAPRPAQRPAQKPPVRPASAPSVENRRAANVNLTGSLNTGNFRVQNTGNFKAQNTANFKTQNTGNFKAQNTANFKTQNTANFKTQNVRRPIEDESVRRPTVRIEKRQNDGYRPAVKKSVDDYLVWFLILSIVLLIALVATFLIIKFTEPAEVPSGKLPNDNNSIQAGVNDPDNNNETTVPEWTVVPSNLKAFVPKSTSSTATISGAKLYSAAAIVVDLGTARVISEYNPDTIVYPASLTKVMTAIVACDLIKDMKDTFVLTNEIINPFVAQGASRANFYTGEPITMEELLYGVILPSGADACAALAIKLCGSEEAFVAKMNEKAAAIGCTKTRFVNPTGLHDDGHYSTARDMATILSYAMNNPFLRQVLSAKTYTTKSRLGNERDGFYYDLNCIWAGRYRGNESTKATMFAAKTGYTPEAGQCLASVLKTTSGNEYVIVTLGARPTYTGENTKPMPYKDAKYLADTYLG